MSETPFMQLYVGDYLADTMDLTTEQHGAYMLLLMNMWRHDARLPNDPAKLARIARVSPRRWHQIWAAIERFFFVDGNDIGNKRLDREHQKAVSISRKRRASGAKGGRAKALKNKDSGVANATDLLKHSQISEPEPDIDSSDNSENKINVVPADAGSPTSDDRYAFCAETIRLTGKDLERWRSAFPHVSLEAELWALDPWAGQEKAAGKNWFHAVSNALAKREREMVARIHMARASQRAGRPARAMPDPRL